MPIPQTIHFDTDSCGLAKKWLISQKVAGQLVWMASQLPFEIRIISGFRSRESQEDLIKEGKPAAPVGLSTHCSCPATGVDLLVNVHPADQIKIEFGRVAQLAGFRWGGGSPADPVTGIPSDWNHLDLGRRQD